jgi:large subunit ribosomal protein L25
VLHVDFHAVSATEEIEAEVVLEPEGDAIGVKTYGGLLQQNLHTLPIKCLPRNLPELIKVDVTNLNVGEALHVSQIALPAGVTAALDGDVVAFLVSEPTVSAESSSSSSEEAAAPEVLKEKKPEAAEAKK